MATSEDEFDAIIEEEEVDLMDCPLGAMINVNGEDFMAVITSIRDALLTHNKILYKLSCSLPQKSGDAP